MKLMRAWAIVWMVRGGVGSHKGAKPPVLLSSPRFSCVTSDHGCDLSSLASDTVPQRPVPIPNTNCGAAYWIPPSRTASHKCQSYASTPFRLKV